MVAATKEATRPVPDGTHWHYVSTNDAAMLEKNVRSLRAVRDRYASLYSRGLIHWDSAAKKVRHLDDVIAEGEARLEAAAFKGTRFEVVRVGLNVTSRRVRDKRLRSIVCERASLAEANRVAEGMEREHADAPRRPLWKRLIGRA
jgi:hypothetical protein